MKVLEHIGEGNITKTRYTAPVRGGPVTIYNNSNGEFATND